MTVLVDLGTSRTAVALVNEDDGWMPLPAPDSVLARRPASWSELSDLIDGASTITYIKQPPHYWVYSRYCTVQDVVLPISLAGTDVVLPFGTTVVPSTAAGTPFSIKQSKVWAAQFIGAIREMVRPFGGEGQQWVIGRSSGAINPLELNLPGGTKAYNEATAVMFAALAEADMLEAGGLREAEGVLVADLGGGFLDISVADGIEHDKNMVGANIVSYGGYPLGVDRIGKRFDRTEFTGADALLSLIALAVNYHLWDYRERTKRDTPPLVILAGGGFARLEATLKSRRKVLDLLAARVTPAVKSPLWANYDTKQLTLSGLRLLAGRALVKCKDSGLELSAENPMSHGVVVVRAAGLTAGTAATWSALLDDLRRKEFGS